MRKIKLIVIIGIMTACPAFAGLNKNNISIYEKAYPGLDDIENAIIIRGIETDLTDSLEYDLSDLEGNKDTDSVKEKESTGSRRSQGSPGISGGTRESYITFLKKKDKKWHLTPYKIRKSDNLWTIARKFGVDHKIIIRANSISNPDRLDPGKTIYIPNRMGVDYRISRNDTLLKISKKYDVAKNDIISNNNIKGSHIREGDILFIPDGVAPEKISKNGRINDIKKAVNHSDENYSQEKNLLAEKKSKLKSDLPEPDYSGSTDKEINEDDRIAVISEENKVISGRKFAWPVKGKITSAFGKRVDPINNSSKFHCGLDISAPIGSPVRASAAGKAIFSGWKKGYGRVVILKHDDGYITVYAHNKKNLINEGERTGQGEIIALSGMSGAVTGAHLHFEIRKYLTPLNPMRLIE